MSAFEFAPADAAPLDDELVEVGRYSTEKEAAAHGLVILAAGEPYWIDDSDSAVRVLVARSALAHLQRQLVAYDRESLRWPPPPIADPWQPGKTDLLTPLLWAVVVLAIFYYSTRSPTLVDRAALDARAVFQWHEGWRVVTALFVHADAAHVISNALSGILVFAGVVSTYGRLKGWLLILISAALGNLAAAAANHAAAYVSLGASTAIFAGVGLLAGRAVHLGWRSSHPHRWRAMFAPLAAGATVLALYGAGGQRVDVGAHLTGFLAGACVAFFGARWTARRQRSS